MHTSSTVRLVADDEPVSAPTIVLFQLVRGREHGDPLRRAIAQARQALLARVQPDGSIADPRPVCPRALASLALSRVFLEEHDPSRLKPIGRALLEAQRADGGWSGETCEELDLSATVLAYFALKLSDQSPASEPMVCARRAILSRGGATNIDAEARTWLALFGQWPYETPGTRRAAHDAVDIINALRPRRHIGSCYGIRELLATAPRRPTRIIGTVTDWCHKQRTLVMRRRAVALAKIRLLEQNEKWKDTSQRAVSPGSLAITLVALDALGLTADTSPRRSVEGFLDSLVDLEAETPLVRLPADVAAAAQALAALQASGLDNTHADVRLGQSWLASQVLASMTEIAAASVVSNRSNASVPDMLPPALKPYLEDEDTAATDASSRPDSSALVRQLLEGQRRDGSWSGCAGSAGGFRAAKPDLCATAQAVMALASSDADAAKHAVARAAAWLCKRQQPDGSWRSTTQGAVHATSSVLQALTAAGCDCAKEQVAAGAAWFVAHQQTGGGWGDALPAQREAIAGEGPATARHTAAALLGLIAAGQGESRAVADGVRYLLSTQWPDGEWPSTASGVLETADPLLALAAYARRI